MPPPPLGDGPAPPEEEVPKAKLRFRTAAEIGRTTPEAVPWVVPGYLALGVVTELTGKIKLSGKTSFALAMVSAILERPDFLDLPVTYAKPLYLTEQADVSFRPALERAGLLEREDMVVLSLMDTRATSWPGVVDEVRAEARRRGCQVVITDTLSAFARFPDDKESSSGVAMTAMEPLLLAAALDNLAILTIRHERKSGGDLGDAARGSTAFGGAADILLLLSRPARKPGPVVRENPTHRELWGIGRFDETPECLLIARTPDGYEVVDLNEAAVGGEQYHKERQVVWVVLPRDPRDALSADEVVRRVPTMKRTKIQQILTTLKESMLVGTVGRGVKGDPTRYFRASDQDLNNPDSAADVFE